MATPPTRPGTRAQPTQRGAQAPALRTAGLTRRYGPIVALEDLALTVDSGGVTAVLGPSGSGKSTLLRLIAGLEPLDAGGVWVAGRDVSRLPAHRRGVGLVFQDHALFPHLDVRQNVAFGLVEAGWPPVRRVERVAALLRDLGLEPLAARRIDALSGGERQRVALARALAPRPAVLLLDEPLASLDRELRERLADDLADRLRRPDLASVLVTHDLDEAATVADRLLLLRHGPPSLVVREPVDAWVARFVGHPNVFEGTELERLPVTGGDAAWLRDELIDVRAADDDAPGVDGRLLRLRPQRGGLWLDIDVPAWGVRIVWRGAARELPAGLAAGAALRLAVPTGAWRRLPVAAMAEHERPPVRGPGVAA
jgi:ABC-type Fe3+/spermidine/putrescine transport system ATPase subunit